VRERARDSRKEAVPDIGNRLVTLGSISSIVLSFLLSVVPFALPIVSFIYHIFLASSRNYLTIYYTFSLISRTIPFIYSALLLVNPAFPLIYHAFTIALSETQILQFLSFILLRSTQLD
jgi:hypothetical protein